MTAGAVYVPCRTKLSVHGKITEGSSELSTSRLPLTLVCLGDFDVIRKENL